MKYILLRYTKIIADGNCFYRSLSQALDKSQENYKYYRELIFNYIEQHKKLLSIFFTRNDNETDEHYESRYNSFISSIRNNYTFAGDFEISTASIILNLKYYVESLNAVGGWRLVGVRLDVWTGKGVGGVIGSGTNYYIFYNFYITFKSIKRQ